MVYKYLRVFEQTMCVAYCLYSGMFWLVAKYHPAAIAGQLVDALVCLALWYQNSNYKWVNEYMNICQDQTVGDKGLPDLVVCCEPQPHLRKIKNQFSSKHFR